MKTGLQIFVTLLVVTLIGLSMSAFMVDQRHYALVLQFGEVKYEVEKPGLHFKLPLVQNVRYFDRRVLTIDSQEPELVITSEKKNVLVDSYVKWRIVDPRQYYISVDGEESRAATRLFQTINDGLRAEFGKRTVQAVVSGERDKIMQEMRAKANKDARNIGVEVLDVRMKRVELPPEVSNSVYTRMESERKQFANELRSTGTANSEKIRADADLESARTIANAYKQAQIIKGKGDAEAAAIYARAFKPNPEFYAFYRSLEAYRNTFKSKQDVMVMEPNSDFFKYLKNAK
ncbi:MAG: protease modulator HflC [Zoogloeaceae bacterium]|jgi:membrane protease subunit HflC|nr:protease modulator HflC [Zoogloeaceae bacterium]